VTKPTALYYDEALGGFRVHRGALPPGVVHLVDLMTPSQLAAMELPGVCYVLNDAGTFDRWRGPGEPPSRP
jgi:hypothetical protein